MTQSLIFPHLRINVTGMDEDHIAELETAKAAIWSGQTAYDGEKEEYLCHQLVKQKSKASDDIQTQVISALPYYSFWGSLEDYQPNESHQESQKLKLLWIDQMIADIKEQLK